MVEPMRCGGEYWDGTAWVPISITLDCDACQRVKEYIESQIEHLDKLLGWKGLGMNGCREVESRRNMLKHILEIMEVK